MRVMQVAVVTVLVMAVHKHTVDHLAVAELVLRRTRAAAAAVIGVVGLQEILRNLIARELVGIRAVAVVQATAQLKWLFLFTRRAFKQVPVHLRCRTPLIQLRQW
jgi:hypothetical protein